MQFGGKITFKSSWQGSQSGPIQDMRSKSCIFGFYSTKRNSIWHDVISFSRLFLFFFCQRQSCISLCGCHHLFRLTHKEQDDKKIIITIIMTNVCCQNYGEMAGISQFYLKPFLYSFQVFALCSVPWKEVVQPPNWIGTFSCRCIICVLLYLFIYFLFIWSCGLYKMCILWTNGKEVITHWH